MANPEKTSFNLKNIFHDLFKSSSKVIRYINESPFIMWKILKNKFVNNEELLREQKIILHATQLFEKYPYALFKPLDQESIAVNLYFLKKQREILNILEEEQNILKQFKFNKIDIKPLLIKYQSNIVCRQQDIAILADYVNGYRSDEDQIASLKNTITNLQNQVAIVEKTNEMYLQDSEDLKKTIQATTINLNLKLGEINKLKQSNEILQENNTLLLKKQTDFDNTKKELEGTTTKVIELQEKIEKLNHQLITLETKNKQDLVKQQIMENELNTTRNHNENLVQTNNKLIAGETESLKKLKEELSNSKRAESREKSTNEELLMKIEQIKISVNDKTKEIESLKEICSKLTSPQKMESLQKISINMRVSIINIEKLLEDTKKNVGVLIENENDFVSLSKETFTILTEIKEKNKELKLRNVNDEVNRNEIYNSCKTLEDKFQTNIEELTRIKHIMAQRELDIKEKINNCNNTLKRSKTNYDNFVKAEPAIGEPILNKATLQKNLNDYENQVIGLYNNFLKTLLKPGCAHLSSYPFNGTLKEQLLWLSDNTKKSEDIFLLKSLIHARLNNTYTQRLYEKDATSSGLQIISMLMRDPKLAQLTNVIGSSYNDIYDNLIFKIIDDLNARKAHVTRFLEYCLNIKTIKEFVTYNDKNTDTTILKSLLTSVNKEVFDTVFKEYILDLKKKNPELYDKLNNFKFQLPSDIREIENMSFKDKLYKTLFKLREYTQDTLLYEKLPPNLLHRKLVKVIVMAFGYSQGDLGRIDTLVEQIQKFFMDNGYSKVPLTEDEVKYLATYINGQFHKTRYSDLAGVTEFMKIITDFTKDKDKIEVNMLFLNWCMRLVKKIEFRHNVKLSHNVNHKFIFYLYTG